MPEISLDRVRETSVTVGTGPIALLGPVVGCRSFAAATAGVANILYGIVNGAEWELGQGHLGNATTLVRDIVLLSSNGNALVSFSAGTKDVFITLIGSRLMQWTDATGSSFSRPNGALSQFTAFGPRTLIKTQGLSAGNYAYVTEHGREGLFRLSSGDYSAQVAADTQEGIYFADNAIASSTAAWVRVIKDPIETSWFGVTCQGDADEDTQIVQAAIDALPSTGGGNLRLSLYGTYKINATLVVLDKIGVKISGPSAGQSGGAPHSARLSWYGNAGGTVMLVDGCSYCTITDLQIVSGSNAFGVAIDWDKINSTGVSTRLQVQRALIYMGASGSSSIGIRTANVADANHENGLFEDLMIYGPGTFDATGLEPGSAGASIGIQTNSHYSFDHICNRVMMIGMNICFDMPNPAGGKVYPGGSFQLNDCGVSYANIFIKLGSYHRHRMSVIGGYAEYVNRLIETPDANNVETGSLLLQGFRAVALPGAYMSIPYIRYRNKGLLTLIGNDFVEGANENADFVIKLGINGGNSGIDGRCVSIGNLFPNTTPFDISAGRHFTLSSIGDHGMNGSQLNPISDVTAGYNTALPVVHVFKNAVVSGAQVLTYGATINTDCASANIFRIIVTNGSAFAIADPTSAKDGQVITYRLINSSGGEMGAITWGDAFKITAWANPASGFSRAISFEYNGTNWVEISRTTFDVSN